MLLAIDAGNTNFTFAVYDSMGAMVQSWRCQTNPLRTGDEYAAWLYPLLSMKNIEVADIDDVIVSSVVPEANMHLRHFCETAFGLNPMMVGDPDLDLGLVIALERPSEVGADRLADAVAVLNDYHPPAIVIDFGTATTFEVINGKREYRGGVIAPGVNLSMRALQMAAAKLPRVPVARTDTVIGQDTVTAMQSGIFWGYVSLIEGMVQRIAGEMGEKPFVIATGGLSGLFCGSIRCIDAVDEDLTLRGLLHIYNRNRTASLRANPLTAARA